MTVLHEIRLAVRSLSRVNGLFITVVLTLALGIGANAAIFSVVRGVLLKPLAHRSSETSASSVPLPLERRDRLLTRESAGGENVFRGDEMGVSENLAQCSKGRCADLAGTGAQHDDWASMMNGGFR
jgi:hypothetical protein